MHLIDTHTFFGKNEVYGLDYSLSDFYLAREMFGGGGCLKFVAVSVSKRTNHLIPDVVRSNDDLFCGAYLIVLPPYGCVPKEHSTSQEEIGAILADDKDKAVRGLKFINFICGIANDSERLFPYIEMAEEYDIPFMFHCSSTGSEYGSPKTSRLIAERFPGVDFIFAHLGGMDPDFFEENKALARGMDNVYLNTTGSCGRIRRVPKGQTTLPKEELDLAHRQYWGSRIEKIMQDACISQKLLFGTDYPYLSWDSYPLDILDESQIDQLNRNAQAAFRLRDSALSSLPNRQYRT
jgi:hypothetical protein